MARKVAQGDIDALARLVFGHYRAYLCGIVRRYHSNASDEKMEEILHSFYEYLALPASDGSYRLRGLDYKGNPMVYIGRALDNRLADLAGRTAREHAIFTNVDDIPEGSGPRPALEKAPDTADDSPRRREMEVRALIHVLELSSTLPAVDRYILYTYLLAARYSGTGGPLKLSEKLGRQLGMKPSTVYSRYDRTLRRLRAEAKEKLSQLLQ